jgi:hypothetical protein
LARGLPAHTGRLSLLFVDTSLQRSADVGPFKIIYFQVQVSR